ncbi:haloacid dehalogenase-like hydrolase domain-containing protein At2g33255 [Zingiber officinale]|uniref:haloacid dehalogenase-like hydrolase domain-containing protein At2g33255 n=1 Tax=Zingiber officinale TaxID=94328 RepID=UPI001C4BF7D7|nr:haloacid dehalogenase-like hydrolase domain-containing protein At2g33255 [Zingiber officinale]
MCVEALPFAAPHLMPLFLPPPPLFCNGRWFSFRTALSLAFSPPRRLRLSPMSSAADDGAAASAKKGRLRGLVFDMDGTLTVPAIDFGAMYRAVLGEEGYAAWRSSSASGGGVDILHHIESWPTTEKLRAYETIAHFERQGLDRLQIMPGALELCKYLDSREIRRGLITRNVKASVDIFHQRFGMEFAPALSREFRPYKPDPAPLLHICSIWDIPPSEVMMIGDSLRDDVACGKRAGAFTCLLDETGRYDSLDSYADDLKPDFKVSSLSQVLLLLENHFELVPRLQTA